jgi:hypothetical protein
MRINLQELQKALPPGNLAHRPQHDLLKSVSDSIPENIWGVRPPMISPDTI